MVAKLEDDMQIMLEDLREKYPQYNIGGIFAGERDKVGVNLCTDWPKENIIEIFSMFLKAFKS